MKKILIILGAVAVAACANAASVQWSLSGVTSSPDNTAAAGWVAYFMDGSTYDAFSALSADKVGAYAAEKYTYTAKTTAGRTGVLASATSGTYSAGDDLSAYIVLFDAADATAAKNYAVTPVLNGQIPAAGNMTVAFTFAQTSGWQTTAVPEPTSGLLMLLGMAGLALRRRRA